MARTLARRMPSDGVSTPTKRSLNWSLVRSFALAAPVPALLVGGLLLLRAEEQHQQARVKHLRELTKVYAYNTVERLRRTYQSAPVLPDVPLDWPALVWGSLETSTLPPEMSLFVFDQAGVRAYASFSTRAPVGAELRGVPVLSLLETEGVLEESGFRFTRSNLPVGAERGRGLVLVIAEPMNDSPMSVLGRRAILLLAAGVLGNLLLVIPLVRRRLEPLATLQGHTASIVRGESESELPVPRYKEYRSLFSSLDQLSRSHDQRGQSLQLFEDVGEQMEATPREEDVVLTVLRAAPKVLRCTGIGCVLLPRVIAESGGFATGIDVHGPSSPVEVGQKDLERLRDRATFEAFSGPFEFESVPTGDQERARFLVRCDGVSRAVIWADWRSRDAAFEEGKRLGRSLARQLELALSKIERTEKLELYSAGSMGALARAIDASSPWTSGHSERVSKMAYQFALFLGLGEDDVEALKQGGLVHDIGKIGIDRAVLDKAGALSDTEMADMRRHPAIGHQILEPLPGFQAVLGITLQHHEWWDGSGYPMGIREKSIGYLARVTAVVDVFDALTSPRPYRPAFPEIKATEMVLAGCGTQFDPEIGLQFLQFLQQSKVQSAD